MKCPALKQPSVAVKLKSYLDSIQRYLESTTLSSLIRQYPQFISEFQEEVVEVRELSLGKVLGLWSPLYKNCNRLGRCGGWLVEMDYDRFGGRGGWRSPSF